MESRSERSTKSLTKGLNAQIVERGESSAPIGYVAICVYIRNIDSSPRSVEKGVACRDDLPRARILGAPFHKGEACSHVVHVEDDVGEARVGQEMRVDGRVGCIELQFHDGLENHSLWVLLVRGNPRFRGGAVGKERKAAQTPSRGPSGRVCEDVDSGSKNLFLCEEDCDAELLCGERS